MGRRKRHAVGEGDDTQYAEAGDPLLMALFENDEQGAMELIRAKADIHSVDQLGWTALHRACFGGLSGVVTLLLDEKADVNACDHEKQQPLHVAVSGGHSEVVKVLLEAGANKEQPDAYGMKPSDYALYGRNFENSDLHEILSVELPPEAVPEESEDVADDEPEWQCEEPAIAGARPPRLRPFLPMSCVPCPEHAAQIKAEENKVVAASPQKEKTPCENTECRRGPDCGGDTAPRNDVERGAQNAFKLSKEEMDLD